MTGSEYSGLLAETTRIARYIRANDPDIPSDAVAIYWQWTSARPNTPRRYGLWLATLSAAREARARAAYRGIRAQSGPEIVPLEEGLLAAVYEELGGDCDPLGELLDDGGAMLVYHLATAPTLYKAAAAATKHGITRRWIRDHARAVVAVWRVYHGEG